MFEFRFTFCVRIFAKSASPRKNIDSLVVGSKMTNENNQEMPLLGANQTPEAVPGKGRKDQVQSLVAEIHSLYRKCKLSEKENFLADPRWKNKLSEMIVAMSQEPHCVDLYNPNRGKKCTCMRDVDFTDEVKERVANALFRFALLDYESRHLLVLSWIRYANIMAENIRQQKQKQLVYILIGTDTTLICRSAISRMVGFGKAKWRGLLQHLKDGTLPGHALKGMAPNKTDPAKVQLLDTFFEEMESLALPRATRIVRTFVKDEGQDADHEQDLVVETLRDADEDIVELPASFTKRSLYKRFMLEHGWVLKVSATGNKLSTTEVLGVTQTELKDLPSWSMFVNHWAKGYPKLQIQKPREDICGQCYTFANAYRHNKRKRVDDAVDASDGSEDGDSEEEEDNDEVDETIKDATTLKTEELILEAGKHVMMAQKQRELYNQKKQLAQEEPTKCRTYTVDYAQNTLMPHFGDEQPGETYYYSPVNCYTLGIVNCGLKPMKMFAHVYFENEGKKGGNNVASLLYKQLFWDGFFLPDRKHVEELNFVFDNCGGQNKNRMVLRMLLFFIKREICNVA